MSIEERIDFNIFIAGLEVKKLINQRAKEANDNIAEMCDYLRFGKSGVMRDPATGVLFDVYIRKEGTDHVFSCVIDYQLFNSPCSDL